MVGYLHPDDYILSYINVPKSSNHSQISGLEFQLMYEIKKDLEIDWTFVIRSHMMRTGEWVYMYLPYISQDDYKDFVL